jgi:cytochrome d ubiquinol oxidase subunit I
MQYPVGCEFNPDTMRNEMVSFAEVALSPFAVSKFCHTVTSAWIIGAIFCVGVCCWFLLKKRNTKLAVESMKIGAGVGLVAALLAVATGHKSGMDVAKVQPMKLAAMEALYDGGQEVGLKIIEGIELPYGLSIMATNDPQGFVPGINDILNGYTDNDGKVELSVDEKIERGKKAIEALANYRQAKFASSDDGTAAAYNLSILKENMPYFGYGYIKDKNDVVPPVAVNFWAFRIMVGVGCLFILFFAVVLFMVYKKDVTKLKSWHYWLAILLIPLGYIGSECGWLVAEFGRQPWTIQDMLPTWAAVSDLQSSSVIITFFLFLVLFTTMLAVEINILLKQIKNYQS